MSISLTTYMFQNLIFPFCLPAVTSGSYEDENCSTSAMSEEDSETQSNSSFSSGPNSPLDLPCPFSSSSSFSSASPTSTSPTPSSRPCSLDLPSTVSLSDFSLMSPILGPRSECSGASSPECDLERGEIFLDVFALMDGTQITLHLHVRECIKDCSCFSCETMPFFLVFCLLAPVPSRGVHKSH